MGYFLPDAEDLLQYLKSQVTDKNTNTISNEKFEYFCISEIEKAIQSDLCTGCYEDEISLLKYNINGIDIYVRAYRELEEEYSSSVHPTNEIDMFRTTFVLGFISAWTHQSHNITDLYYFLLSIFGSIDIFRDSNKSLNSFMSYLELDKSLKNREKATTKQGKMKI